MTSSSRKCICNEWRRLSGAEGWLGGSGGFRLGAWCRGRRKWLDSENLSSELETSLLKSGWQSGTTFVRVRRK